MENRPKDMELIEDLETSVENSKSEHSAEEEDSPTLNEDLHFSMSTQNMSAVFNKLSTSSYSYNRQRSQFWLGCKLTSSGRHLFSTEKSIIHWTTLKTVVLSAICYFLLGWIQNLDNISDTTKSSFSYSLYGVLVLFTAIVLLDPGYVLDHQFQCSAQELQNLLKLNKARYCQDCQIFVKKKTVHCYVCGHCIANYDHHCGVMSSCVGGTNVVPFFLFVFVVNVVYCALIVLIFYEIFFS